MEWRFAKHWLSKALAFYILHRGLVTHKLRQVQAQNWVLKICWRLREWTERLWKAKMWQPQFQFNLQTCKCQSNVIVTQPGSLKLAHEKVPTSLDLAIIDGQMGKKYSHSESPDSNLTLDSDSSGVYMSNPSQTSREDITMSDLGSITSFSQGEEGKVDVRKTGTYSSIPKQINWQLWTKKIPGLRANSIELGRQAFFKEITTKATEIQARLKPVGTGSQTLEIHNTVNTSKTDVPLPLSPPNMKLKKRY